MLNNHQELISVLEGSDADLEAHVKMRVPSSTQYSQALGHARALVQVLKEAAERETHGSQPV